MRSNIFAEGLLEGQVALITGGGTGIGRATALQMAALGARVALVGRRDEPLENTAARIREAGGEALAVSVDLREADAPQKVVDAVLERFGRIDVLFNNAGGQFQAPAEEISVNGFRAVHRLSVEAVWNMTQEVANRCFIPQRGGTILFIAFSPRRGIPGMVHASAARAAIENMAAGLSMEWSRFGIRSVCVAPGSIVSEGLEQYSDEAKAGWKQGVPLGRLGTPEDVAGLLTFLVTPAATYITGTTITVDGGADAWGVGRPVPEQEIA